MFRLGKIKPLFGTRLNYKQLWSNHFLFSQVLPTYPLSFLSICNLNRL